MQGLKHLLWERKLWIASNTTKERVADRKVFKLNNNIINNRRFIKTRTADEQLDSGGFMQAVQGCESAAHWLQRLNYEPFIETRTTDGQLGSDGFMQAVQSCESAAHWCKNLIIDYWLALCQERSLPQPSRNYRQVRGNDDDIARGFCEIEARSPEELGRPFDWSIF